MAIDDLAVVDVAVRDAPRQLHESWNHKGFVGVTGYDPLIDVLHAEILEGIRQFVTLPDEVKQRHIDYANATKRQRGWNVKIIRKDAQGFNEVRAYYMFGPRHPEGHPNRQLQAYNLFRDNMPIPEVPGLVDTAEELLELLEREDLRIFEGFAAALGLPPSYFSSRIAYGDSSLRVLFYDAIPFDSFSTTIHDGVRCDQDPNGMVVNGIETLNIVRNGEEFRNVLRSNVHTDIDVAAALLGDQQPGLWIQGRDGTAFPYTPRKQVMVYNAGRLARYETICGRKNGNDDTPESLWPASPHWVTISDPKIPRFSVVRFVHYRPQATVRVLDSLRAGLDPALRAQFPDTTEAECLVEVLRERGQITQSVYEQEQAVLRRLITEVPDDAHVRALLRWEQTHIPSAERKLERYASYLPR